MNAHHQPREVSGALHREGADEEVQDRCGKDGESRHVVQVIQAVPQGAVIQVPTACEIHTRTRQRVYPPEKGTVPLPVTSLRKGERNSIL